MVIPVKRFVFGALVAASCLDGLPALAQSQDMQPLLDRLARLERDIRTLNVQVARGGGSSGGGSPSAAAAVTPGTPAAARLAVRLDTLEGDLRSVTGRIEELNHHISKLNRRLDKMSNDMAFRQPGAVPGVQGAASAQPRPQMMQPVPGVSPAAAAQQAARAQALRQPAMPAQMPAQMPAATAAAAPAATPVPAGSGTLGSISQSEIDAIRTKRNAKRAAAGKPVAAIPAGGAVAALPTEVTENAPGGDVSALPVEVGGGETALPVEVGGGDETALPVEVGGGETALPAEVGGAPAPAMAPAPAPVTAQAPAAAPAAAAPTAAPLQQASLGTSQPTVGPVLPDGSPREQYLFAFNLLRQAKYTQAERALMAFLEQHPEDRLAANARYWLGETYYVRGDFVSAAEVFLEGYQTAPAGPKAADALLKLGMSLASIDKKTEACAAFDKVRKDFPTAPAGLKSTLNRQIQKNGCI